MGKATIVDVKNLCKSFNGKKVLNNLNFSVCKGELFVIVGPDGAGKTTLLRILSSIYQPSSGSVNFLFERMNLIKELQTKREKIGYMPQKFSLYDDLTVMENLEFFSDMFLIEKYEIRKRIERLLRFSQLKEFSNRAAGKLSGGMQKKLALSCSLLHEPEILLLDEPTNGVDPISRAELWNFLYSLLDRKKTIILTTSYMEEAEKATHVGFLMKGSMELIGKPEHLKSCLSNAVFAYTGDFAEYIRKKVNLELGFSYFVGPRLRIVLKNADSGNELNKLVESKEGSFKLERETVVFEDIYLAYTKGMLNAGN